MSKLRHSTKKFDVKLLLKSITMEAGYRRSKVDLAFLRAWKKAPKQTNDEINALQKSLKRTKTTWYSKILFWRSFI